MDMTKLEQLGRQSALEAIDQVNSFKSLGEAVDSYWCNLGDTIVEMQEQAHWQEAERGFLDVLQERGIKHIPVI